MKKFMGDEKPRGKILSCYYSVSMATLTGLEPAFIVLETTAYPPCSSVYLYWCPWRDSNSHHLASKASASTSWTTRALTWSGEWGSNPRPLAWQARALPLSYLRELVSRKGFEPLTFGFVDRCSIQLSYRDVLEVLPRVELGSQGFAVPRLTVCLKHQMDPENGFEPLTCGIRIRCSTN